MSTVVRKNKKLSKKHTARANQLIQQALTTYQTGQLQSAEQICLSILAQYPQFPDAVHLLGVIAYVSGNLSDSVTYFEQAIKLSSDYTDAHINLGNALLMLNQIDKAIVSFKKAIRINPELADAWFNMGNAHLKIEQYEKAIDDYKRTIKINPNYADAYNNLGNVLQIIDRNDEALEYFQRAVEINPNFFEAYNNLGNSYKKLNKHDLALNNYKQAINLNPQYASAYYNIANVLKELDCFDEAISCYKQAIQLKQDYADAYFNLGLIYQHFTELEDARINLEQAIKYNPENKEAFNSLANVLYGLEEIDQAISIHEQLIKTYPDFFAAYNNLANIFFETGKKDESIEKYEQALAINPGCSEAYRHISAIKPDLNQIDRIKERLQLSETPNHDKMHYHHALGANYNHIKSYQEAFHHYSIANQLKRESFEYDAKAHSQYVDKVINTFSDAYFQTPLVTGSSSERPIFIVGMPRSGTTLIEQIISSHPDVVGAGELIYLPRIEKLIDKQYSSTTGYPECMINVDESLLSKHADEYLTQLTRFSKDALRVSDKMPDNFLRIGLIKQLFPNAKIIHCQRNALDTCLSIYLTYFSKANYYSYDLHDLGNYYLDYVRIMEHWNSLFSSELFEIQYEELVSDQEKLSRRLIEYIGLEWDDECLNFYNNDRTVKTASNLQVKQPVYNNSVNRWKRYENELQPLIKVLQQN
jgi:tetratricopeptide (TPR) repeat protein